MQRTFRTELCGNTFHKDRRKDLFAKYVPKIGMSLCTLSTHLRFKLSASALTTDNAGGSGGTETRKQISKEQSS